MHTVGHAQCKDRSDETNCETCPPIDGPGHPPRLEAERLANRFPCKHRFTKKPICSIACDGLDDLCEGYEDERNCHRYSSWVSIVCGVIVVLLIIALFLLLDNLFPEWSKLYQMQFEMRFWLRWEMA